jgi:hypothetical protein
VANTEGEWRWSLERALTACSLRSGQTICCEAAAKEETRDAGDDVQL